MRVVWTAAAKSASSNRRFAAALVTLLACEPPEAAPSQDPSAAPPTAEADAQAAAPQPSMVMPTPHRSRGAAALSANAACEGCHSSEAAEWRGSRHQQAFTSPAFREALELEPAVSGAFCRGCHAPEADARALPSHDEAALGVGCVTCHETEPGAVLVPGRVASRQPATARVPHAIMRSPEFAQTGACAACHEFRFPFARGDSDEDFMQTTLREHQRSPAASQSCSSCHMPRRKGGRSHRFDVREPEWLRASLELSVEGTARGTVIVTLGQKDAAHAFPTGDLFRRVEVGVALRTQGGVELAKHAEHLTRHLVVAAGGPSRVLERDDRVFFEPAVVEIALPLPANGAIPRGAEVSWWVSYQRVAQTFDGRDPTLAVIESQVPLFVGVCSVDSQARTDDAGYALNCRQGTKHDETQ